jgi:transcriptional regulator GlxA family with amidase domain
MGSHRNGLTASSPNFPLEEKLVKIRPAKSLTAIEKEVIAEIRTMRLSSDGGLVRTLLENPALLVHHFVLASHGNVRLRLSTIAGEVAVEMRTLERAFFSEYKVTMTQFQVKTRFEFAKWLLGIYPPTKISAIASTLGYERVQDFNRFFKKHTRHSPAVWARLERARIAGTGKVDRDK